MEQKQALYLGKKGFLPNTRPVLPQRSRLAAAGRQQTPSEAGFGKNSVHNGAVVCCMMKRLDKPCGDG